MPVLPLPEVPGGGDGEGGGEDGQPQGPEGSPALEAEESTGGVLLPARVPDHGPGEGPGRHQPRPQQS